MESLPLSTNPHRRTGAPRSPERTPDFLSNLLALANLMRLSLLKAAHVYVGGAPCRKSGYVGRKRGAQPHKRYLVLRCFSSKLPQNRHPERSASQVIARHDAWWRGVEGPRRCLSYPCFSELFNHRSPHRADPPRSFPGAELQELPSILLCPAATSTFPAAIQPAFYITADPVLGDSVVEKLRKAWVR
jgi:hypothetical protein